MSSGFRGRETDLSDAEWLADVAAHGMVRPSFVPPLPIRELRELTRYHKTQVDARVMEIQRLEKLLQDAGIKLTSVASRTWSKSALAVVEALIAGERDPQRLAELSKSRMRARRTSSQRRCRGTLPPTTVWWLARSSTTSLLGRLDRPAHEGNR